MKFIKFYLRGHSPTTKLRRMKPMMKQIIVDEMSVLFEDTLSGKQAILQIIPTTAVIVGRLLSTRISSNWWSFSFPSCQANCFCRRWMWQWFRYNKGRMQCIAWEWVMFLCNTSVWTVEKRKVDSLIEGALSTRFVPRETAIQRNMPMRTVPKM